MSRARYQLSELHCCSFVRLPAFLLAYSRYILSFALYIIFLSLALSVSWPRPYLPALAARWDNDGHLVNRKHRFLLRLYRTRQGKGKSRQILLKFFGFWKICFYKFFAWYFIFFNVHFLSWITWLYLIIISYFARYYKFIRDEDIKEQSKTTISLLMLINFENKWVLLIL